MTELPIWILVFMFNGLPMASGPHELPQGLNMSQYQKDSHCWNPKTQERKRND